MLACLARLMPSLILLGATLYLYQTHVGETEQWPPQLLQSLLTPHSWQLYCLPSWQQLSCLEKDLFAICHPLVHVFRGRDKAPWLTIPHTPEKTAFALSTIIIPICYPFLTVFYVFSHIIHSLFWMVIIPDTYWKQRCRTGH
jgi:hypothetical protein